MNTVVQSSQKYLMSKKIKNINKEKEQSQAKGH